MSVHRRLGVPTAVNHLAPLTDPALPSTSLVGCSDTRLAPVPTRDLAAHRGWGHGLDAAFADALAAVAPAVDSGAARTLLRDWVEPARSLSVP